MEENKTGEKKQKKMSFFKRVFISIKDFEKYQFFALENIGKSIQYLIQLLLVFTIIITTAFTYRFYEELNRGINYVRNQFPDFTFADATLKVNTDKPVIIHDFEEMIGVIIVDTTSDQENIDKELEQIKDYENGILVLKDKVIVRNALTNISATYTYQDLVQRYGLSGSYTKSSVLEAIDATNKMMIYGVVFALLFIYLFTVYLASVFVDSMILAALAYITARFSRVHLRFSACLAIAIHALTLSVLLNAIYIVINVLTGFEIRYFQIMYTTVSYIYVITAILMIKSDLIKQQIELARIIEEQERLKEEEERKRQEEEQEQRRLENERRRKEREERKKKEEEEQKEEPKLNPEGGRSIEK